MLAICLQKIREAEIKWIIRLNLIIKTMILRHLDKIILMDISNGNNRKKLRNLENSKVTEDEKL